VIALLLLLACKKDPTPQVAAVSPEQAVSTAQRSLLVGPVRWTSSTGLCADLPEGWQGTASAPPQLLDVAHEGSQARLRVAAWPWGTPIPVVPQGAELVFHDLDSYRRVPLLRPSASYTLRHDDGHLVQGWYGDLDGRVVVVEVEAPFGRTTEARSAAEPLLSGLARCFSPGDDGASGR
jgi:hypothetical protein